MTDNAILNSLNSFKFPDYNENVQAERLQFVKRTNNDQYLDESPTTDKRAFSNHMNTSPKTSVSEKQRKISTGSSSDDCTNNSLDSIFTSGYYGNRSTLSASNINEPEEIQAQIRSNSMLLDSPTFSRDGQVSPLNTKFGFANPYSSPLRSSSNLSCSVSSSPSPYSKKRNDINLTDNDDLAFQLSRRVPACSPNHLKHRRSLPISHNSEPVELLSLPELLHSVPKMEKESSSAAKPDLKPNTCFLSRYSFNDPEMFSNSYDGLKDPSGIAKPDICYENFDDRNTDVIKSSSFTSNCSLSKVGVVPPLRSSVVFLVSSPIANPLDLNVIPQ